MASASAGASGLSGTNLRISPRSVQQQTVETLRKAILSGAFQPGERLVEADICARLGVSRPSLREALRSLEAERLVVIVPNRGPHIPIMTWSEAKQIYHARALMEGEAAALCALRAGPHHLRRMKAALNKFAAAVANDDAQGRVSSTAAFYQALLDGSGNSIIDEILKGLSARISLLRARSMSGAGRPTKSIREMTAIFEAVQRGDDSAARAAAIHHVEQAALAAAKAYEESGLKKT